MDDGKQLSTLEYLLSAFAGVVARVESLPLAALGDFVRGRMGAAQSTRGVEGLFESLLAQLFGGGGWKIENQENKL